MLAAVGKHGPAGATVEEIVADAYDDVPVTAWPSALLSTRAHLEKLVAEGRVEATDVRFMARGSTGRREGGKVWG